MHRIKPDVDIIKDLLHAVLEVQTESTFTRSLLHQYEERGGLSKKQLQGLYNKAAKMSSIPPGKLATLEAIILKRPTRYKSVLPVKEPEEAADDHSHTLVELVLKNFPAHKRVLFFKSRLDHQEKLSPAELSELEKFSRLVK